MNKVILLLVILFGFIYNASANNYFSHSIINLPYEYETKEPWVFVINSKEEFEVFYLKTTERYLNSGLEIMPIPEIDFNQNTLVLGGLGTQMTGAIYLAIAKVVELSETIYINAVKVVPGSGCGVTADIANPTTGVLLKKTNKKIVSYLDIAISDCN
jgi:hypothetical protein